MCSPSNLLIGTAATDKRYLLSDRKRRQELNNLFAKMYEDRLNGLEENYSMRSVKYRTEQQQLDETIKTVSARLEGAKAETDDAKRELQRRPGFTEGFNARDPMSWADELLQRTGGGNYIYGVDILLSWLIRGQNSPHVV